MTDISSNTTVSTQTTTYNKKLVVTCANNISITCHEQPFHWSHWSIVLPPCTTSCQVSNQCARLWAITCSSFRILSTTVITNIETMNSAQQSVRRQQSLALRYDLSEKLELSFHFKTSPVVRDSGVTFLSRDVLSCPVTTEDSFPFHQKMS